MLTATVATMKGTLRVCVLILYCCYLICTGVAGSDPDPDLLVETKNGKVLGKYSDVGNARVFMSIPYGGPVSGTNRWKDPQPHADWTGVWDTTLERPNACPQGCKEGLGSCAPKSIQTEDCLFLNVYTPHSATPNSNLPVLVFIHGGAYVLGYSAYSLYDGSYLASNSDIIVVTMNYRLGALGFFVYGSGSDAIDGNFGIKDQRLALHWVQDNIAGFGGNPKQITLSGESAGAMSVAIHMTSMKSTGLFHKAIVESDPFGIYYRTAKEEKKHGDAFAMYLLCTNISGHSYDCLRDKPVEKILEYSKYHIPNIFAKDIWAQFLTWAPVIDGDQLTDQPLELFNKGHFNRVPTIMGTTTAEGIMFVYGAIPIKVQKVAYSIILATLFGGENLLKLLELYPPDSDPGADQRTQLSVLFTDYGFYCPTVQSASSVVNFAHFVPVYSYIFNHPFPDYPGKPELCKTNPCHGAELPYVFHTDVNKYTDDEKVFADIVSRYWGNFVKTGNPNTPQGSCPADGQCTEPLQSLIMPDWPQFTSGNKWESLSMDVNNFQAKSEPRKTFCDVLDDIGYGADLFGGLRQSRDIVTSFADLKSED